ncbi:hypothetical protein GJAV_G00173570 [Gymnothorax javanicus]|nr:hypothetical protein GJAV_G00173570 [Gymnothorax javanicus]
MAGTWKKLAACMSTHFLDLWSPHRAIVANLLPGNLTEQGPLSPRNELASPAANVWVFGKSPAPHKDQPRLPRTSCRY